MKIYVVRHGETIINTMRLINSINPIGLNKNGKKQAKDASKQMPDIDLIICSPIKRTKQTCKIMNIKNVDVIYDDRVIERNSRSMQFKKINKIDFEKWYDPTKDIIYKDSEGFKSILNRIGLFLENIKNEYPDKNILIVTHGNICKAIRAYLLNIKEVKDIYSLEQKNCQIIEYNI